MKPSQVKVLKAVSVQFARIERLAHQKKRADAYVGRIQVLLSEDEDSELTCGGTQKLEEYVHGLCGIAWGNDPLWHDEETRWLADYGIQVHDEDIAVRNHASEGKKVFDFPRPRAERPSFRHLLSDQLKQSRGNRQPVSIPDGGPEYPDDYKRWCWPALRWLHRLLALDRIS